MDLGPYDSHLIEFMHLGGHNSLQYFYKDLDKIFFFKAYECDTKWAKKKKKR